MAHSHDRGSARHVRPLAITFALVAVFFVVEVVAGLVTNSLVLLADAGHMLTDAVGLGMALAAIVVASRAERTAPRTYGLYRLEIIAALLNALLLAGVATWVIVEAVRRFADPPTVVSVPLLVVALAGLAVNVVGLWLLRAGSRESLNVEGARMEVLADLVGSIGVVLAAVIMLTTGWAYADPLFGAALGVFILPRATRLGWKALHVLVQAAPADVDLRALEADLVGIPGVVDVHDLHVWTLTSGMDVASLHLLTREGIDPHVVLDEAETLLRERHHVAHATLQVEPESHRTCAEVAW